MPTTSLGAQMGRFCVSINYTKAEFVIMPACCFGGHRDAQ
jgi:hypothetical protein